jgi:hypothetical protein
MMSTADAENKLRMQRVILAGTLGRQWLGVLPRFSPVTLIVSS